MGRYSLGKAGPTIFYMASFYAELHVAGHVYPVRICTYGFSQATGARGRVVAKVRPELVYVTLDVPRDEVLQH